MPEFQKFLLEKKLVPDKNTPFYAGVRNPLDKM
jgi:hypothetical protein